jgi:hypothetical protein
MHKRYYCKDVWCLAKVAEEDTYCDECAEDLEEREEGEE